MMQSPTDLQFLTLVVEGGMALVTLNRPAARNALSSALMHELIGVAHALSDTTTVHAVILTGGAQCFSAGADLHDAQAWADESLPILERREIAALGFKLCRAWEEIPAVTIAAIEGYAVGGGLALSLACDWRVAAEDAFVALPEIALGIPLTWGTIPRLVNLVGPAKAKRLTILCERVSAADAMAMGLVDRLASKGASLAVASTLAAQVLTKPAAAVRMSKESINAAACVLNHASTYMANDQIALAASSPDSRAARAAALRKPTKT